VRARETATEASLCERWLPYAARIGAVPNTEQTMSAGAPSPPGAPPEAPEGAGAGERSRGHVAAPSARGGDAGEFGGPRRRRPGMWGPRPWAPSPALRRAELLWAAAAAVALAVLTSWPLVLHLPSRIAPDLGDPVRTAWQVAWVGHAMAHGPLHIFDANAFYPHRLSLAFSDSLLGYGPTALFGSGTVAALVRYNLLFLFAWSLCFLGAYLLARELGLGRSGSLAAGAAFAYAPYRVTEAGHLHVISSGGIPLALFLLLRGYRNNNARLVLAGWLLSLLALWQRQRPPLARRLVVVTCAGVAAVALVGTYQARPYLKVSHDYQTAKRTIREVKAYSAGPSALLAASTHNRVWAGLTSGMRANVHSKNESVLFPGGLLLVLAAVGLAAPVYTRRMRAGLLAGAVTCAVLALGLGLTGAGYPYRLLYDYAPGWNGVRARPRVHPEHVVLGAARGRGRAPARRARGNGAKARVDLAAGGRRAGGRLDRRRCGPPGPPGRASARSRREGPAGAAARPPHRWRGRPPLAVLLDGWFLPDPHRQQHLRHPGP
jgi:hypothetical protein